MVVHYILLVLLLVETIAGRPPMQRLTMDKHEWLVPNEPGWKDVMKEATEMQERLFSSCTTVAECRRIVEIMHTAFMRYPVSRRYLEHADDDLSTIFKWG